MLAVLTGKPKQTLRGKVPQQVISGSLPRFPWPRPRLCGGDALLRAFQAEEVRAALCLVPCQSPPQPSDEGESDFSDNGSVRADSRLYLRRPSGTELKPLLTPSIVA